MTLWRATGPRSQPCQQNAEWAAAVKAISEENARLKQPVTADENFHFERGLVMQTLTGTEHLRNNVQRHLSTMTSGEQWSLYRAIAKLVLASRSKEPEGEQR